jgi:hypothetical protein
MISHKFHYPPNRFLPYPPTAFSRSTAYLILYTIFHLTIFLPTTFLSTTFLSTIFLSTFSVSSSSISSSYAADLPAKTSPNIAGLGLELYLSSDTEDSLYTEDPPSAERFVEGPIATADPSATGDPTDAALLDLPTYITFPLLPVNRRYNTTEEGIDAIN